MKNIDKMAIFGLHISIILRERAFGRKKPILRGFTKWLTIRSLRRFWQKLSFVCFQKSTPQKNLALTFEILACLQKREKWQKMKKKRAQKYGMCANIKILLLNFSL